MNEKEYLRKLKDFWEVSDLEELKFNRVETLYGAERTAAHFDRLVEERVGWLLGGLALPADAEIVEIGCGIGAVLQRIAAHHPAARLQGLDISESMIAQARRTLAGLDRVELRVIDGDQLSGVRDQSVDLVICTGVFIHILDSAVIRSYVRDAFRVLKPGGAFRFNCRYWDPEYVFGASPGARLVKFLYRIGWYSALRADARKVKAADFNGLHFTLADIERLLYREGFLIDQLQLTLARPARREGYLRVNGVRPA
ncbi:MAG: class I SAM-dependent methyltransferase [Xanthomonadales bacterium]|nr:class I SAM-dependent methyltransferase [Xanthomonadales bacterium]